jgi:hypothetical protein
LAWATWRTAEMERFWWRCNHARWHWVFSISVKRNQLHPLELIITSLQISPYSAIEPFSSLRSPLIILSDARKASLPCASADKDLLHAGRRAGLDS